MATEEQTGEVRTHWGLDTADLYTDRGIGGVVGFGVRPALVVVDLANGFTDTAYKLGADVSDVIEANQLLIGAFRSRGFPVVFTTTAYHPDMRDAGVWVNKIPALSELQLGSHAVEIDERLGREPNDHLVTKKYGSSFFMTNLSSLLVSDRVDTVVVTGVSTSGCVRATVIDSCSHGFRTIVPVEAVGDRAEGPHAANLFDMDAKYADVVSTESVVEHVKA
jgi:maleamate amidohydrolase